MVTHTLNGPVGLGAILNNIQKGIQKYICLLNNPNKSFNYVLKVHPVIVNDTLIMSLPVLLTDNTFHLQMYQVHNI